MNIEIRPPKVTAVQLDDGWHEVQAGSFEIEHYRYGAADSLEALVDPYAVAGFTFTSLAGDSVSGTLASITAIRHRPEWE
jgi:hypothetical protein